MRTLYLKDRANDQSATIIHDSADQACYLLTGKWGLRHDALSLYTMQGELIGEIKQLSLGLRPKFVLYQNHQRIATISKSLGFVREFVYIHDLNWLIVGSALTNHFRVFRNSHLVFTMEPDHDTAGLYCRLVINQQADEPAAILVACILNHWAHRGTSQKLQSRLPRLHFNRNASPELGCCKELP